MATTPEAFDAEMAPYYRRLYGFALRLCGDPDRASDLTQDSLIKAYRAYDRFREGAPIMPWLMRILRNTFLDDQRSARARYELRAKEGEIEAVGQGGDQLSAVSRSQLRERLEAGLEKLPEHHAAVLIAVDVEGLDYTEAALVLDVPVGTIRSRLNRARAQLRALVVKQMEPEGLPPRIGGEE